MVILLDLLLLIFIHLELFQENLLLILRQQGMYLFHPPPLYGHTTSSRFWFIPPPLLSTHPLPPKEDCNWSAWLPISVQLTVRVFLAKLYVKI